MKSITQVQNSTTINVDNCPSSLISWRMDALLLFSGFCFWSSLGLNSWVLILFHCQLSTAQARINRTGPDLHLTSFPATVGGLMQGTLLVWVLMVISLRSSEFRWKSSRYRNSPHSNPTGQCTNGKWNTRAYVPSQNSSVTLRRGKNNLSKRYGQVRVRQNTKWSCLPQSCWYWFMGPFVSTYIFIDLPRG